MTKTVSPLKIADAAQSLRHVFIRDLLLDASIGIYDREKQASQPIRVNIDLTVLEAVSEIEDKIENVVCYEDVVDQVATIVREGHINLVETLAERIAATCLEDSRVKVARVRVEKLKAIENAESVGVEIERIAS